MFDSFFTDTFNGHDVLPDYYGDGDDSPPLRGPRPTVYVKIRGEIKKETEKAYLVDIETSTKPFEHWLPKSKVSVEDSNIKIPFWLLAKLENETKLKIKSWNLF